MRKGDSVKILTGRDAGTIATVVSVPRKPFSPITVSYPDPHLSGMRCLWWHDADELQVIP
jgi:hypothetical protein